MKLDLALSYTPPGSDLSMTLAVVRDVGLLVAVLKAAIDDAERGAAVTANPLAVNGLRVKLAYLQSCLQDIQIAAMGRTLQ